jgi:tetratricopeptide (TPR) repeat protein
LPLTYSDLRRLDEAIDCYRQALPIFREVGEPHFAGGVLNNIGDTYRALGRLNEAIDSLEEALKVHREIRDRWSEGEALQFLGLASTRLSVLRRPGPAGRKHSRSLPSLAPPKPTTYEPSSKSRPSPGESHAAICARLRRGWPA